jgi:hypothetical protein
MTHDQIDRIVRQANPVPDLKALEPVDASVLVLDQQRRTEMQTHDRIEVDHEPEKPRYGTLIGIAAAAAIVIGVLILFRPAGNGSVAADATAVDIATGFVEAYGAFDVDRAASYLAVDAVMRLEGNDWRLGNRLLEAMGFKLMLDSCEEVRSGPTGTSVRCMFESNELRSDEIGLGPFSGSYFDLTVLDGEIVRAGMRIESAESFPQMWEPFAEWVSETYPEDAAIMYGDASHNHTPELLTDEVISLWEQRSREYVEVARERAEAEAIATAFVEAYAAFDVDEAASYLAADADISQLEWGDEPWLANRMLEAESFTLLLDSCDALNSPTSGTVVRCTFDFHALRSDEIGLGPFSGSSFDVTVQEGEVARASMQLNYLQEFSPQIWDPFAEWMAETYPDDVAVMYADASQSLQRLTEESFALWEQRSREYVEVVKGASG